MIRQILRKILISLLAILGVHYWGFAYFCVRTGFFFCSQGIFKKYLSHIHALFAGGWEARNYAERFFYSLKASFSLLIIVIIFSVFFGIYFQKIIDYLKASRKLPWLTNFVEESNNYLFIFLGNFFFATTLFYVFWIISEKSLPLPFIYEGLNLRLLLPLMVLLPRPTIHFAQLVSKKEYILNRRGIILDMIPSIQRLVFELLFVEYSIGWPGIGNAMFRGFTANSISYSNENLIATIPSLSIAIFFAVIIFLKMLATTIQENEFEPQLIVKGRLHDSSNPS